MACAHAMQCLRTSGTSWRFMVPKDRRNLYEHGALVWLAEAWIVARRSFGEQKLYRRAGSTRYSARAACSMTVFQPCVMAPF